MPPKTILVTPASDVQREIIALTPGDTLVFADGIYRGGFTVPCTGTLADPITIKAANKWKAVIMGNSASEKHGFSVTGSRIRFDGLHVFGALGDGIKFQASKDSSINGTFNTVQNCWIHHNLSNGIGGHFEDVETMALELINCLIEFNGSHPAYDHGIYVNGSGLKLKNCVIRSNAGWGVHCFGGALTNSVMVNNVISMNGGFANCGGMLLRCPTEGGNNFIINNTIVTNRSYPLAIEAAGVGGPSKIKVINNIIASESRNPSLNIDSTIKNQILEGNACSSPYPGCKTMDYDWRSYFVHYPEHGILWLMNPLNGVGVGINNPFINSGTASHYDAETILDFWGDPRGSVIFIGAFPYKKDLDIEPNAGFRSPWRGGDLYSFSETRAELLIPDIWTLPPTLIRIPW